MAQTFCLREQAERCRRLARASTDPALRDSPLKLADEYAARAAVAEDASEDDHATAWQAGSDEKHAD
jgi:hypothetical protein